MCPLGSQSRNYSFFLSDSGISGSTQKHDLGESSSQWMLPSPTAPPEALSLEDGYHLSSVSREVSKEKLRKTLQLQSVPRRVWVLTVDSPVCCLYCPLPASSPLELPPLGMLITGPQNHLAHGLAAFCWASVHNDASFPSSLTVLPATFTFSWVSERGLSTLNFIRIENQAGRHL